MRIFLFVSALLLMTVIAAIGMFYYIFGIPEPEGVSLASWPNRFTENFSVWMEDDHGEIKIEEIGLKRLDEYGLWLQVIDESGREVFSHNKPISRQISYRASELIALSFHAYEQGIIVDLLLLFFVYGRLCFLAYEASWQDRQRHRGDFHTFFYFFGSKRRVW